MASLNYRRGGWELRYRDRQGKERTERFPGPATRTPPEAALDRKADVERELRRGTYVPREEREATFREYYDRWWKARIMSRSREYTDTGRAKLHVLPYWGGWRLCDIRPSDIDDWVAMLSRKMGPTSVRHCYTLLRGPLRRAVKDRVINDPCVEIALPPKKKIQKGFDDVLTGAEVCRLVASIPDPDPTYAGLRTNHRYAALVLMGCWLGPRWNEAIGVRVCDVNPLRSEIVFGRVCVNQVGSEMYLKEGSKTDDTRVVPVPKLVMDALVAHMKEYCAGESREEFLFLTKLGTHPKRGNFHRDVLRPAVERAVSPSGGSPG